MKRYGYLWKDIIEFDNLFLAARQAQKGKRYKPNVLEFNDNLACNLLQLQSELHDKSYCPGPYYTFRIFEPKPRLISAAPYRDRVVHHALCNIIVPLLERSFIPDTYANRLGYGTHRALKRFKHFARSSQYVLQCDIRKYFPSIDHAILKQLLRRCIKCPDTLWLLDLIIDSSKQQEPVIEYFPGDELLTPILRPKGLPIGNLKSQFLANFYLNEFDHFIKEKIKCKRYLRFDDYALFSDDSHFLLDAHLQIDAYLLDLRLKNHPTKTQLFATKHGVNFVGFRILPDRVRVRNDNLRRTRVRIKQYQQDYARKRLSLPKLIQRLRSWEAHVLYGDTHRLRRSVFFSFIFRRSNH